MATMNVSLPGELKKFVEERVRSGEYANSSDYVRDLIRRSESNHRKLQALQRAIDDGVASGPSDKSFDQIMDDAREAAKQRGHAD